LKLGKITFWRKKKPLSCRKNTSKRIFKEKRMAQERRKYDFNVERRI